MKKGTNELYAALLCRRYATTTAPLFGLFRCIQLHRRRPLEGVGAVPIVEFTQPSPLSLLSSFLPGPKVLACLGEGQLRSREIEISFGPSGFVFEFRIRYTFQIESCELKIVSTDGTRLAPPIQCVVCYHPFNLFVKECHIFDVDVLFRYLRFHSQPTITDSVKTSTTFLS